MILFISKKYFVYISMWCRLPFMDTMNSSQIVLFFLYYHYERSLSEIINCVSIH